MMRRKVLGVEFRRKGKLSFASPPKLTLYDQLAQTGEQLHD